MFLTIIGAVVVGAIIGALARLVMPGKQSIGVVMTILLGVVGSLLGSWACTSSGSPVRQRRIRGSALHRRSAGGRGVDRRLRRSFGPARNDVHR